MDRQHLSDVLTELIGNYVQDDKKHVFFQSPASYKLVYPTIIYHFNGFEKLHADNVHYKLYRKYSIQLITRDPDSDLITDLECLPYCSMDRDPYVVDNLYHYNYTIYY